MTRPIPIDFLRQQSINSCAAVCTEAIEKVCAERNNPQNFSQDPITVLDFSPRPLKITLWREPAKGCQKSCEATYTMNQRLFQNAMKKVIREARRLRLSEYVYSVSFSSELGIKGAAIATTLIQKNPDLCNPPDSNPPAFLRSRIVSRRYFRWNYQYWGTTMNRDKIPIPANSSNPYIGPHFEHLALSGKTVFTRSNEPSLTDSISNALKSFGNILGIQSNYLVGSGAQTFPIDTGVGSLNPVLAK